MAAPDMEVIKEIPGYKVILKAVLKSQIQQLVEQLASHTEEETVVLTASLSDGTLSHLGSASGKSFLEDHEEMKSQFLGFCLKRHHQKSQEKALRHLEMQSPGFQDPTVMGYSPHPSQRGQIGTSRTSKVGRHEPYRRRRGQGLRQTSGMGLPATDQSQTDSVTGISGTPDNSAIKTESESIENESSNQSLTETGADSNVHDSGHLQQTNSESTDLNTVDSVTEPLADFTGDGSNTDQSNELDSGAICDNSINVKQEEGLDSDLELQITGMEPARSTVSQDNWGGNMSMSDVSMDMTYDPIGATGSSLDIQAGQQGYRFPSDNVAHTPLNMGSRYSVGIEDTMYDETVVSLKCPRTGQQMEVKQYTCLKCDYNSFFRSNLKRHVKAKHLPHTKFR